MNRLTRLIVRSLTGALWIFGRRVYMASRVWYLGRDGVIFTGSPHFIHPTARLDPLGGVRIGDGVTISAEVFVLTHDYAITKGLCAAGQRVERGVAVFDSVIIGANCFLGLRCILLPGTVLGNNVIVGAGSVVRGTIPDNSVVVGNPAKVVAQSGEWARKCLDRKRDKLRFDSYSYA